MCREESGSLRVCSDIHGYASLHDGQVIDIVGQVVEHSFDDHLEPRQVGHSRHGYSQWGWHNRKASRLLHIESPAPGMTGGWTDRNRFRPRRQLGDDGAARAAQPTA